MIGKEHMKKRMNTARLQDMTTLMEETPTMIRTTSTMWNTMTDGDFAGYSPLARLGLASFPKLMVKETVAEID